jgi:hypothetical protein
MADSLAELRDLLAGLSPLKGRIFPLKDWILANRSRMSAIVGIFREVCGCNVSCHTVVGQVVFPFDFRGYPVARRCS